MGTRISRRNNRHAAVAAVVVFLFMAGAAQAQDTLRFAGNRVSVVLPVGFQRMPKALVDVKYPRAPVPEHVFSNEQTTVSIAAGYTPDADLTAAKLPEFKAFMEGTFERSLPDLNWIARGFKDINGKRWIHLELESKAVDTRIRNIVLMTNLDNGLVMFNFNATAGDYEAYRTALEESWLSIRVQSAST